jgi:hypothetical protein
MCMRAPMPLVAPTLDTLKTLLHATVHAATHALKYAGNEGGGSDREQSSEHRRNPLHGWAAR